MARGGAWLKVAVVALVATAAVAAYPHWKSYRQVAMLKKKDLSKARIVMYSRTECVPCGELRATFRAAGVPFTEHYVDINAAAMFELGRKLTAAGYRKGATIGVPTLDVNGTLLPDNPSVETIARHL